MAFMPLTWQSWKWQLSLRTMLIQYDSAIQKQTKLTQWLSAQRSEGQLVDSLVPANKERNKPENSPNLLLSSVWGTKRTKKCLDMEASVICIVSVEQSCQDKLGTNSIQKYPGHFLHRAVTLVAGSITPGKSASSASGREVLIHSQAGLSHPEKCEDFNLLQDVIV